MQVDGRLSLELAREFEFMASLPRSGAQLQLRPSAIVPTQSGRLRPAAAAGIFWQGFHLGSCGRPPSPLCPSVPPSRRRKIDHLALKRRENTGDAESGEIRA